MRPESETWDTVTASSKQMASCPGHSRGSTWEPNLWIRLSVCIGCIRHCPMCLASTRHAPHACTLPFFFPFPPTTVPVCPSKPRLSPAPAKFRFMIEIFLPCHDISFSLCFATFRFSAPLCSQILILPTFSPPTYLLARWGSNSYYQKPFNTLYVQTVSIFCTWEIILYCCDLVFVIAEWSRLCAQ